MTDKTAAFSAMVERHSDLIWHICSDYSLSAAWEVEDAFQEVMCVLWRDYEQFDRRSKERTWVYRVATNTKLMLKRKKSNQPQPLVEKIPDTPPRHRKLPPAPAASSTSSTTPMPASSVHTSTASTTTK